MKAGELNAFFGHCFPRLLIPGTMLTIPTFLISFPMTQSDSHSLPRPAPTLQRILGVGAGLAVSMGVAIGAGIFRNPGEVAGLLPTGSLILLVWLAGGMLTLIDALVLAELSTFLPKAGGWYVYLRAAYGQFPAFLYGWASSLITYPGSVAAVAVAIGEYFGKLVVPVGQALGLTVTYGPASIKAVAITAIVIFTILNLTGLRTASWAQQIFTSIKVLALLLIVGLAFGLTGNTPPAIPAPVVVPSISTWVAFGIALQFVVWTYDGYADVITLAEEMKQPARDIPRALLGSIGSLTVLYLLLNAAFLYVLSPAEMAASKELVAAEVFSRRTGAAGEIFLVVLAFITVVGGLNAHLLSGPRITFAMARDGLSFAWLSRVTERGTPIGALLLQSTCAVILTLTGTFESLIAMTIFVIWITNALNTFAVFLFRRWYPDADRPYRIPGYPVVPLIALLVSVILLINMVRETRHQLHEAYPVFTAGHIGQALQILSTSPVLMGIFVVMVGIPVYWLWQRVKRDQMTG